MRYLAALMIGATLAPAALAGNSLIPQAISVAVAKSPLTVRPDREWNKMGARPGRNSETWTLDGDTLNDLTFYGGIADDKALFREVNHHDKPLPHFAATMLLTDIPALIESSYRLALDTALIRVDKTEPATLGGRKAIHFAYTFTRQNEEVRRRGEGWAAIVGGKLYMITFEAPEIHFFDDGIAAARAVVASATLPAG